MTAPQLHEIEQSLHEALETYSNVHLAAESLGKEAGPDLEPVVLNTSS